MNQKIHQPTFGFSELAALVAHHIQEVEAMNLPPNSAVKYLLEALRIFQSNVLSSYTAHDCKNSADALRRFAIDSLKGDPYRRVDEILLYHSELLHFERRSEGRSPG